MNRITAIGLIGLLGLAAPPFLRAQTIESYTFTTNRLVPDGRAAGLHDVRSINSTIGMISSLKVRLKIDGEFNGDLYGYLRHVQNGATNFGVLLNRVGRATTNSAGYADGGFDVTFDQGAPNGDIHFYRYITIPASPLNGTWQPDGRTADPTNVTELSGRLTSLNTFNGGSASGEWTLFLADLESGGTNMLKEWGLDITGGAYPSLAWSTPSDVGYGTLLSGTQLNASATYNSTNVPGTFTYSPPAGTVLAAGAHTLSVVFTPEDATAFLTVSNSVTITVTPAALNIVANGTNKVYGETITFAGTEFTTTGLTNGDTVTSVTLASAGTVATAPASTYPITASDAVGTGLTNYTITYTDGVLTVTPAALAIAANPQTKVYGTADPALTYTASGFQAGDTEGSVLTGNLTRTAGETIGSYAITQGSLVANTNYTINFTDSALTITPASLTIAANTTNKVYGTTLTLAGTEFISSGLVSGDTLTGVSLESEGLAATASVGTYAITVTNAVGTGLTNYDIAYSNGVLTVDPASLTIVANSTNKVYGETITFAGTEFASTGLVNSDTVTSVTLASAGADASSIVGTYPITATNAVGTGLTNYTIGYTDGTLNVGQAATIGSLAAAPNPAAAGAIVTLTEMLSAVVPGAGTPTGTVDFRIDGTIAGSGTLSSSVATFDTSSLAHGSHTVVAEYAGDSNFAGTTNTLTPALMINSAPIAGADTVERYPTQGVKVQLVTLLANDTDADGDTLTVTVSTTSANGGTISVADGWVFYTPAVGDTNVDSFTYTIVDGYGGTNTGTVTVNIKVDNESGQNLTIVPVPEQPGTYRIIGSGIPGRTYHVQTATSLETPDWQDVPGSSVTADVNGLFQYQYTDPLPTPAPQRYFRTAYP